VKVVAVFEDLLLGSNVLGMLEAAGHDATLTNAANADATGADLVIVDLQSTDGPALAERFKDSKLLGVYSHVDADTKRRAEQAGFDLVVPRSRFAREGASLVDRLGAGD
jgi:hypothetical protein